MSEIRPEKTRQAFKAIETESVPVRKGRLFESLASSMLEAIEGVDVPLRNQITATGDEEIDLLAKNTGDKLPGFAQDILVSCKAEKDPVSAKDIRLFADSMRERQIHFGLLFSLHGATGGGGNSHGAARIQIEAVKGQRILVLTRPELELIASGEHFALVLEGKRDLSVASHKAVVFDAQTMKELDPSRGRGSRGLSFESLREAEIRMRKDRFAEVSRDLHDPTGDIHERVTRARQAFNEIDIAEANHDPDADWFMSGVYGTLLEAARSLVAVLQEGEQDPEFLRRLEFDVAVSTPGSANAHCGTRLWQLLVSYYFGEVETPSEISRERAVHCLLYLLIEEMNAIMDIEPPYDDWPDPS